MNEITPYRERELSARQAAFVKAYVETGDAHMAGLAAGYAPATARNAGSQLLESPAVILAIGQAAKLRLARGAPIALNTVQRLMTEAHSERVRLEAAKTWLDRAGLIAPKPADERGEVEPPLHELSIDALKMLVARAQAVFERGEAELASRAKPINATASHPVDELIG